MGFITGRGTAGQCAKPLPSTGGGWSRGRLAGLAAVLGNASGLVFWASASVFGLTALIRTSEFAFLLLLAVGLVRRTLARPSVKARVEQISGLVLFGLGLRMITLSRAAL
jgi:threonine/homoserine/homoserine lactone efflux protein